MNLCSKLWSYLGLLAMSSQIHWTNLERLFMQSMIEAFLFPNSGSARLSTMMHTDSMKKTISKVLWSRYNTKSASLASFQCTLLLVSAVNLNALFVINLALFKNYYSQLRTYIGWGVRFLTSEPRSQEFKKINSFYVAKLSCL